MNFDKPALDIPAQLVKLQGRGLVVNDTATALHYLQFVGYYRLSAYALPFQEIGQQDKPFKAGTTFETILDLYRLDRELRLLVMDAIERIEVAVRSSINNEMGVRYGPHWFMEPAYFVPGFRHNEFLNKLDDALYIPVDQKKPASPHNEVFINHYYSKYTHPYLPPAWMVGEMLSLGAWSQIFSNLKQASDRKSIASHFGIDEQILINWLHALTHVRNLCAHHLRLWNRKFVIKPKIAKKHSHFLLVNDRFYAMAVVLYELLQIAVSDTRWHARLAGLLSCAPDRYLFLMGFPKGWDQQPFWTVPQDYSI